MAATPTTRVLTGIDVLARDGFAVLKGRKVGLITNHTGRSVTGATTIDLLHKAPGVTLVALFSPEHGIRGVLDEDVPSSRDEATGLPIHSLYGATRRPTAAMLAGLDTLVIDLQDIGARFYTYPATLGYVMEEAAKRKIEVVVLDRPNPINGWQIEGPLPDEAVLGFIAYLPMPIRHGLTLGELAQLFNAEKKIGADLTVVRAEGWRRDHWFDQTGLAWMNPSPNMRNLNQATLYPGIGAIEYANVSVGRGTDQPFEQIGAPWIDGPRLAAALNARGAAGHPLLSGALHADVERARRPGVPGRVHGGHQPRRSCSRCASASRSRRRCGSCTATSSIRRPRRASSARRRRSRARRRARIRRRSRRRGPAPKRTGGGCARKHLLYP